MTTTKTLNQDARTFACIARREYAVKGVTLSDLVRPGDAVSRLRSRGLVTERAGRLFLTDAGKAAR